MQYERATLGEHRRSASITPSIPGPGESCVKQRPSTEHRGDLHQYGRDAMAGLDRLIVDAVRCCDERRVAALTRILRDIQMLLKLTRHGPYEQGKGGSPADSFQEQQAPFDVAPDKGGTAQGDQASIAEARAHVSDALTPREKQIIRHLASGSANKVIARNLNITEATVKVHIKALLRKLGLKNRTQAALFAIHQRWLD